MSETAPETPDVAPEPDVAPPTEPAPEPKVFDEDYVKALRAEAAANRTKARDAEAAAQNRLNAILEAAGIKTSDQPLDPAALTDQLNATQAQARQAALELAIYKTAATAKADPAALLDSRTFLEKVTGIDPTDTQALAAAIGEATSTNPRFKVAQAAPVGGADFSGGSAPARTYTRTQIADPAFYKANRTDILAAHQQGRILP